MEQPDFGEGGRHAQLCKKNNSVYLLDELHRRIQKLQSKIDDQGSKIDKIASRVNAWSGEPKTVGYGFHPHNHVDKKVQCPEGTFVVGTNVRYSGACQSI